RFIDRFPGQVAVLHSRFTDSQRYETWQRIVAGEYRVVVGPRSALFAPVRNLGLIVLDEEHESTYKQDTEPRYHARALAQFLQEQHGAALVLGSATPSVESMWNAQQGKYGLIELRDRVNPLAGPHRESSLELPAVEVVDRTLELQAGNTSLISRELRDVVDTALQRGEQAIILLNRRGTATVVLCRRYGHRITCPMCDIPLVFHQDRHQMVCHRCDHREPPPNTCPDCGGQLDFFGAGTQRVEDEVRKTFPRARVMRWDQDAIRRQGGYEAMLARVEQGEVDIVVGTQMVAKGFDLPGVTAIGVVQADSMLHLPDFRAAERTFQLLTQVAGRAGRRRSGSEVVVQTYTPHHYAVQAASRHDYDAFFIEEIDFRQRHFFPPFVRLARYVYRHDKEQAAAIEAEMMAREIARHARMTGTSLDILGPTPAFQARVRGQYQWQVVLRSRDMDRLLDDLPMRPGWVVDIDPQSML
ncbi:MAG TPA: primosomal protein N', partial [Thermomicrobiales bacterium]|nr:primosomal protein N' [Thermomicrobiales bacterium]